MSSDSVRVTALIPNYNYARFLRDSIDSALAQGADVPGLEVLVIDNGSTDDSVEVLKSYGSKIRWFTQPNRGQSGSRNRGLRESRGQFLAFLDADDVWRPGKLARQLALFDRPEVGIVYCGYETVDASLKPLAEVPKGVPRHQGRVLRAFADQAGAVIMAGESTAVLTREAVLAVGEFDERLSISCGWDFFRRVCARYEARFVPEALTLYRQHGSNAHLRIDVLERDVLLRLQRMFEDPACAEVAALRGRALGQSYLMLSGSHWQAGHAARALGFGLRSLREDPSGITRILGLPARALQRLKSKRAA